MNGPNDTILSPTALRRIAVLELLLLLTLQAAPAFELFSDKLAFSSGADRLLPTAAKGSAAIYGREAAADGTVLRTEQSGADASTTPRNPAIILPRSVGLPAGRFATATGFPHHGHDILHISPKHSPPRHA